VTTREGQRALPTGHACEHALQVHTNVSVRDLADLLAETDTHSNTQPVLPDLKLHVQSTKCEKFADEIHRACSSYCV
jgi:hypothetical protein